MGEYGDTSTSTIDEATSIESALQARRATSNGSQSAGPHPYFGSAIFSD
jgi:hypothetical protein